MYVDVCSKLKSSSLQVSSDCRGRNEGMLEKIDETDAPFDRYLSAVLYFLASRASDYTVCLIYGPMKSPLGAEPRMLSQPAPHEQRSQPYQNPERGNRDYSLTVCSCGVRFFSSHSYGEKTGDGRETRNRVFASQICSETNRSADYGAMSLSKLVMLAVYVLEAARNALIL